MCPAFDCCPGCSCGAAASSLPTEKNLEVLIYGRQICVLFGGSPSWQCRQKIRRKFLRIRRPRPLQGMAADGRRQDARQQVGAGSACREVPGNRRIRELQFMVPEFVARTGGSRWNRALPGGGQRSSIGCAAAGCGVVTPRFPQTKHPETLVYDRGMRVVPAAAGGCRPCRPAAASGTGPCPAGSACLPTAGACGLSLLREEVWNGK